jgi:hypothetical protein
MHDFESPCVPYSRRDERKWTVHPEVPSRWLRRKQLSDWSPVASIRRPEDSFAQRFARLEQEVASAASMLDLLPDWDDAGAEVIDRSTWARAVGFLRATAQAVFRQCGKVIPVPRITPSPDGSIDIHWRNEEFELLRGARTMQTSTVRQRPG